MRVRSQTSIQFYSYNYFAILGTPYYGSWLQNNLPIVCNHLTAGRQTGGAGSAQRLYSELTTASHCFDVLRNCANVKRRKPQDGGFRGLEEGVGGRERNSLCPFLHPPSSIQNLRLSGGGNITPNWNIRRGYYPDLCSGVLHKTGPRGVVAMQ